MSRRCLQVGERGLVAGERAFGVAHRAADATDGFIGIAQLARCIAALAFELAAFGRDVLQLAADLLQLLLGVLAALRRRGPGRQRQREGDGERGEVLQAGPIRLWPVISAGCGRPSRASIVGATSRNAPPLRSDSTRGPT